MLLRWWTLVGARVRELLSSIRQQRCAKFFLRINLFRCETRRTGRNWHKRIRRSIGAAKPKRDAKRARDAQQRHLVVHLLALAPARGNSLRTAVSGMRSVADAGESQPSTRREKFCGSYRPLLAIDQLETPAHVLCGPRNRLTAH